MPLVNEHWAWTLQQTCRFCLGDSPLRRVIQTMDCFCAPQCRAGLSNTFGPFESNSRQVGEEFINLIVDDATLIRDKLAHLDLPYHIGKIYRTVPALLTLQFRQIHTCRFDTS
jgi:hypothetical protein